MLCRSMQVILLDAGVLEYLEELLWLLRVNKSVLRGQEEWHFQRKETKTDPVSVPEFQCEMSA